MVPSWGRCGSSPSIAAARQAASSHFGRQSTGIINWYQCWNNRIWGMRSMIGADGEAPGAARRAEGGEVTLLRGGAVKRIALARDAAERANEALHLDRRHLLSVARTGRTGDGLVHQRAAEIVGAAAQTCFHALAAHLHPGGLDVGDQRMQREARDRVHQHGLPEGRTTPGAALEIDRGLHMHEGQRHELGKAARLFLQLPDAYKVSRPMLVAVDM